MRCKFFSIGRLFRLLLIFACWQVSYAQLDWHDNVVVYGSEDDEVNPLITPQWNGQYRAFCLRDSSRLSTRRSLLSGSAWESFDDLELNETARDFGAVSDAVFSYVWSSRSGRIWRINHDSTVWSSAAPLQVDSGAVPFVALDAYSDFLFDPVDTYLHGCFIQSSTPSNTTLTYFRSENRALSVSLASVVDSSFQIQDSSVSVAVCATWSGEEEKLWIAAATDRPGTVGEQIRLYSSDDLGQSWLTPITPDSSSYAMMQPTLASYGELLMLAYQRRNSASLAREVFVTYSPDNGVSWSEPLQITDDPFDDIEPKLAVSGDRIGLFYVRAQTQSAIGELFVRESSVDEPWVWTQETSVSDDANLRVAGGYDATGDDRGFAAVWGTRIVGEDGDIVFDASWRGVSVDATRSGTRDESGSLSYVHAGAVDYDLPQGEPSGILLYDILGRRVAQTISSGRGRWILPTALPSGSYIAFSESSHDLVRIRIVR